MIFIHRLIEIFKLFVVGRDGDENRCSTRKRKLEERKD